VLGGYALTLVDSLDMLAVLGDYDGWVERLGRLCLQCKLGTQRSKLFYKSIQPRLVMYLAVWALGAAHA
jgi:hypothetical protein